MVSTPLKAPRLRVELGEESDRLLYATALLQRGAAQGILLVGSAEETDAASKLLWSWVCLNRSFSRAKVQMILLKS